MARRPLGPDLQPTGCLLRDCHVPVVGGARPREHAAALGQQVARAREEPPLLPGDPAGPVRSAGLLVRRGQEDQVPRQRALAARQLEHGEQVHHGDTLGVLRASAVDLAPGARSLKGGVPPAALLGRHDVEVGEQDQRRSPPSAR